MSVFLMQSPVAGDLMPSIKEEEDLVLNGCHQTPLLLNHE